MSSQRPKQPGPTSHHVSLVALPDAVVSTLFGIFDVMNAFTFMDALKARTGARSLFQADIVGESTGPVNLASGVPVNVQRAIGSIDVTDIVIVPSVLLPSEGWKKGRYPALVDWLRLTVAVHPERTLVIAGRREDLVSSGASTTWHDLTLYLIARYAGATTAQEVARMFALQWHQDGLTPYIIFEGRTDHGDAEIERAQQSLREHFSIANPVEEMIKRSRLAERTFKRRFAAATGLTPISYVQRLRIEDAKRRLERTDASVDEISWRVGYEDAAFFRRLFKRTTGVAPGAYRKRYGLPDFARSEHRS